MALLLTVSSSSYYQAIAAGKNVFENHQAITIETKFKQM